MSENQVFVYESENCMQCKYTKNLLDKSGVPYESVMLSEDRDEYPEEIKMLMESNQILSKPVVLVRNIENEIVSAWGGFKPDELKSLAASR